VPKAQPRDQEDSETAIVSKVTPSRITSKPRPTDTHVVRADLSASLRFIGWLNETLDGAAEVLGKKCKHEMVLMMLILHENQKGLSGRRLVRQYADWKAEPRGLDSEHEVRQLLAHALLARLVEIGSVAETPVDTIGNSDLQTAFGRILDQGLMSFKNIRLTLEGKSRTKKIRSMIDDRLEEIRRELPRSRRKTFDKIIEKKLPYPRYARSAGV
jgi:hypothetical protein